MPRRKNASTALYYPNTVPMSAIRRYARRVAEQAERDLRAARGLLAMRPPLHDEAACHCQQAIEKYLKASLHELGLPTPRIHDIKHLLDLLIPSDRRTLLASRLGYTDALCGRSPLPRAARVGQPRIVGVAKG
jgi:hypothetical protein